jgi:hypothetical protein
MARTPGNDASSSRTARSAQPRPGHKRRAPGPEAAAIVLTPDGKQRLAARAAQLATELIPRVAHYYLDDPDHEGWASVEYRLAVTELARLTRILQRSITTDQLPPEDPGIVELGDEVVVEFAAATPTGSWWSTRSRPPLTTYASRSRRRWRRRWSAAGSVTGSRSRPPPVATSAAS